MTTKAEALRDALDRRVEDWTDGSAPEFEDIVDEFIRIIVEQLGITEECKCDAYSQSCSYCTANVEATQALWELAHHGE